MDFELTIIPLESLIEIVFSDGHIEWADECDYCVDNPLDMSDQYVWATEERVVRSKQLLVVEINRIFHKTGEIVALER